MPIYVYRCEHCGHEFDQLRRIGLQNEPTTCPSCGRTVRHGLRPAPGTSYNWATDAAAHGDFIKEARRGHTSVVPVSRRGKQQKVR